MRKGASLADGMVKDIRHVMKYRVEEFKYLGTTLTNKNSIQEEIKSRLKVWNAAII